MRQQYPALVLFAMFAVLLNAGCSSLGLGPATATPIPFERHSSEDVFRAFARAGLQIQNPQEDMNVTGRGAPSEFKDRFLFEIPRIAPAGGQIIVFATQEQLQAWQDYIQHLSNDSTTHRDVIYVYVKDNVMLQLNTMLTNQEASAFRDAFMGMT